MTPGNPQEPFTPFLPANVTVPEDEDRMRSFLSDVFSQISDVVNDKLIGAYTDGVENINGSEWSYLTTAKIRNGYQAIAYVPSLVTQVIPNPIPNINSQFVVTNVYGSASLVCSAVGAGDGDYFTFLSEGDSRVTFTLSDTLLSITAAGLSAYSAIFVIEYIRDGR